MDPSDPKSRPDSLEVCLDGSSVLVGSHAPYTYRQNNTDGGDDGNRSHDKDGEGGGTRHGAGDGHANLIVPDPTLARVGRARFARPSHDIDHMLHAGSTVATARSGDTSGARIVVGTGRCECVLLTLSHVDLAKVGLENGHRRARIADCLDDIVKATEGPADSLSRTDGEWVSRSNSATINDVPGSTTVASADLVVASRSTTFGAFAAKGSTEKSRCDENDLGHHVELDRFWGHVEKLRDSVCVREWVGRWAGGCELEGDLAGVGCREN